MADVVERYRIVGENAVGAAFNQILRQSKTTADRMSGLFRTAFAGVSLYSIGRFVAGQVQVNDALARGAIQSGIQAKAYTELAYAARLADVEQAALATSLKKMQVSLSQAATGGAAQVQALDALGLEIKELQALTPDKQFERIAEQISRIKNPADRTRAAVELFGRAGADLLPLFERGAAGIREAREEAQRLGKSLSAEDLKRFADVDDAFKRLKESGSGLADVLILKLSPELISLADAFRVAMGGGTRAEQLKFQIAHMEKMGMVFGDNADLLKKYREELEKIVRLEELAAFAAVRTDRGGRRGGAPGDTEPPGFRAAREELDKLKPVVVTAKKIMEDYGEMLRNTATDAQQAAREYELFRIQLEKLLAVGLIDKSEFNKRLGAFLDDNLKEIEVTAKKILPEANDEAKKLMDTLKDEAARRAIDHISDAIMGLGGGARSFARDMINAFRQILADEAAQQLFALLKGIGKGGGDGGILGAIGSGIGALFGAGSGGGAKAGIPGLAGGGFMAPGSLALVGEQGPELALAGPRGATIIPFDKARSSRQSVTINAPLSIDARGATQDAVKQLTAVMPGILKAHGDQLEARIVERMRRKIYDFN